MLGIKNRGSAHARAPPGQTTTTSCNIRKRCMKTLTSFKFMPDLSTFEPTTPNLPQHLATGWRNMFRPTVLRYVAIVWPGLYSRYYPQYKRNFLRVIVRHMICNLFSYIHPVSAPCSSVVVKMTFTSQSYLEIIKVRFLLIVIDQQSSII